MNTIHAQGYNCRPIYVGRDYKLRGHRSHINGRKAQVVRVTGIVGDNSKTETEGRHRHDRFIATDGRMEYYALSRKDLIEIKP